MGFIYKLAGNYNYDFSDSTSLPLTSTSGIKFTPGLASSFNFPTLLSQTIGATSSDPGNVITVTGVPNNLGILIGTAHVGTATWYNTQDYWGTSILTHLLQYSNDGGNTWITYDQIRNLSLPGPPTNLGPLGTPNTGDNYLNAVHQYSMVRSDPRTDRFGVVGSIGGMSVLGSAGGGLQPSALDAACLMAHYGAQPWPGWTLGGTSYSGTYPTYPGTLSDNLTRSLTHYTDPDGVLRPGIGAYTDGTVANQFTGGGYPMALDTVDVQSRPIILNRPFRSVADMGYAFRGAPWKSIDFFHSTSGDAALLDLFTVQPTPLNPVQAGWLDPNTRQKPVLQAMTNGAIKQDAAAPSTLISTADATTLASSLATLSSTTPLSNVSDLVTLWSPNLNFASLPDKVIKARRESAIRALADVANTRTWNLLIDVIAQTGQYPASAGNLNQFAVSGERRYWLHVCLDRYTGKVVSESLELVHE